MDSELTFVYAPSARLELDEIFEYNARRYGAEHAERYVDFLLNGIESLALQPNAGKVVIDFPDRRALTLRKNPRGDGTS